MFGQTTLDQPRDRPAAARGHAGRRTRLSGGVLLALVAVLLLSWANARSATMQLAALVVPAAVMDTGMQGPAAGDPMPGCSDMAPSAAEPRQPPHQAPHRQAPCVVCAVAAHLPVPVALPPAVRVGAVWTVAFLHAQAMRPRGPPAFRARARSPPAPVSCA